MEITKDMVMIVGLVINFIAVIGVVVNSKVKMERRFSILETKMNILMRAADLPHRRSDDTT